MKMGTHFKKSIFEEHVQVGLVGWAQKVKKKHGLKAALGGSTQGGSTEGSSSSGIRMAALGRKETKPETEVQPADGS